MLLYANEKNQVDFKLFFRLEKGKIVFWTSYYRLRKHVGVELHSSWSMNYELNRITAKKNYPNAEILKTGHIRDNAEHVK